MMKFHNGFIELGFTPNFLPQMQGEFKTALPYVAPVYDYSMFEESMNIDVDGKITITSKNE